MPVDFQTTTMDKLVLAVQILVLCLCLYKSTLAQDNPIDWEEWIDVSHCTAKPCNCSVKDRVRRPEDCPKGKVLQVRGCGADRCPYQRNNVGTIRLFQHCYNLNKYCPGWSDWKVVESCRCEPNKTTGKESLERYCDNPPPVEGFNLECVINDQDYGLKDEKTANCNCTEDEEEQQTTEASTTAKIRYCECKNSSSNSSSDSNLLPDYADINFDRTTTTPASTMSTTTNPYVIVDYSDDDDDKKLCVCDDTMMDDVTTKSNMTTNTP